jgi:hypothetical protein
MQPRTSPIKIEKVIGGYWSTLTGVEGLQARESRLESETAFLQEVARLRRSHSFLPNSWWEEIDHGQGQTCYHLILGPKNVKCVRIENRGNKRQYKVSVHWQDHCPFKGYGTGEKKGGKGMKPANLTDLTEEESAPVRTKSTKEPTNQCGCGCGELCAKVFKPGHDSRLKSRFKKIRDKVGPESVTDLPPLLAAAYYNYITGMLISDAVRGAKE